MTIIVTSNFTKSQRIRQDVDTNDTFWDVLYEPRHQKFNNSRGFLYTFWVFENDNVFQSVFQSYMYVSHFPQSVLIAMDTLNFNDLNTCRSELNRRHFPND